MIWIARCSKNERNSKENNTINFFTLQPSIYPYSKIGPWHVGSSQFWSASKSSSVIDDHLFASRHDRHALAAKRFTSYKNLRKSLDGICKLSEERIGNDGQYLYYRTINVYFVRKNFSFICTYLVYIRQSKMIIERFSQDLV